MKDVLEARKLAALVKHIIDGLSLIQSPALKAELQMRTLDIIAKKVDIPETNLDGLERQIVRTFRNVVEAD